MAVTRPFAPAVRALHVVRPGRTARGFVIGALLGVLLVVLGAGRLPPGVRRPDPAGRPGRRGRHRRPDADRGAPHPRLGAGPARGWRRHRPLGNRLGHDPLQPRRPGGRLRRHAGSCFGGRPRRDPFEEALAGLRQMLLEPVSMPTVVGFDQERLAEELKAFADRGYRQPVDAGVTSTRERLTRSAAVDGVQGRHERGRPGDHSRAARSGDAGGVRADGRRHAGAPGHQRRGRAARLRRRRADRHQARPRRTASRSGRSGRARIRMWITFTGQGASYAPQVDPTGVPAVLKRFAPRTCTEPRPRPASCGPARAGSSG